MKNKRYGRLAALCLSFLSGMGIPIARSQTAHADPTQLEEIVVTAEKRESTVQNTPISLTAVSGADIQARGLTDLANLAQSKYHQGALVEAQGRVLASSGREGAFQRARAPSSQRRASARNRARP